MPRYHLIDIPSLPGIECPCGTARRAFVDVDAFPGTLHVTDISSDAQVHYHKEHTETYYILECGPEAALELDGERVPVKAGAACVIPPGVRHRAVGAMKVLIVCLPEFDEADEHFD
ncbi:cupin domain-containing protein [Stratiformator vulcanicus]|uniref:Cupin domain protein n=1 Tax=Stratiformator vulcanicus TaxID=2527980 RepID=A0A517R6Q4_9PLAN|nr:cupin domain-containing protein [Stratiformator vulcanicus]QDT39511.1 Cupin domain protein [Stratiformator vulcanicus]